MIRVLLVDDDAAVRFTLGLALRRRGIETTPIEGGPQALELLRRREFDWLVTDGHMKLMDGYALAREARLLRPGIRIVMITGVETRPGPHEDIRKVFTKPIDDEALAAYLLAE